MKRNQWIDRSVSRCCLVEYIAWRKTEREKLKAVLSESRVKTESRSGFHLFESTVVVAACLVERKESI